MLFETIGSPEVLLGAGVDELRFPQAHALQRAALANGLGRLGADVPPLPRLRKGGPSRGHAITARPTPTRPVRRGGGGSGPDGCCGEQENGQDGPDRVRRGESFNRPTKVKRPLLLPLLAR